MLLGGYSERQHIGWSEEQREGREKELKYLLVAFRRRKEGETKKGRKNAVSWFERRDANL